MARQTERVESNTSERLPNNTDLVFIEKSHVDTHYVGSFDSFPVSNLLGYDTSLLALAPWDDEASFGTTQHKALI